ncbi:MAG: hypothetical protein GY913_06695 [Proteobacteria bacterium]|nr:hypothetical protein [Pseudomonadota bacterium]MCP4916594.1 hypothetical protein [Pseudomonadota bacterium]
MEGAPKLLDLRVFEFEGRTEAFLVREWIEGESLADRLADRGRLSPGLARHVGVAILDILDRLHATGQVHGDVQPANVLLSPDGLDVTLVDAAPLKVAARSGVSAGWNISVADGYCAPEVLITGATPGSDQYSTGRTLLHALGGRPRDEVDEELLRSPEFDVDVDLIDGILQLCSPVTMRQPPRGLDSSEWPTVVLNTVGNQAEWESGGDLRLDRGVESRPSDAQVGFRCCLDF